MHRIMIVDDEPFVLSSLRRSLADHREDYFCEIFEKPADALKRAHECAFDLVLADYHMPEMDGVQFLSAIREIQPDTIRIILSGYADLEALIAAINQAQIFRFISKPWIDYELKALLVHALQYRALQVENKKLADILRVERGKLSRHEAELRRLERESPGITSVKWGGDGEVLFDDMPAEELEEANRLLQAGDLLRH